MPAPTVTPEPLGWTVLGRARWGDGAEVLPAAAAKGLAVSYQPIPPGTAALGVSYALQHAGAAATTVFFWVSPKVAAFAIDDDTTVPSPERMTYTPPGAPASDLSAIPVVQGYAQLTWEWSTLGDAEIAALMAHYDPARTTPHTVTYPNELGFWTRKEAFLQPPNWGQRQGVLHQGVALTFTHISSD